MASACARSGLDLHLDLTARGVGAALESALREAVRSGRLRPGARLPSSRGLALDLGLARNTVLQAYDQLVAEGWLTARPRSGTRVADLGLDVEPLPQASAERKARFRYDLRAGFPDLSSFPRAAWGAATMRALNTAPYEAFGYCDPQGRAELRASLVEYLCRARGLRITAEQLVICTGFAQALELLCEWLRTQGGHTLGIEALGERAHRSVAASTGLRLRELPVDEEGAVISELRDADAVLLTPAHQFPLGVALSPRRRSAAVDWAVERDRIVIEDDYDGEFRYDRVPVGAMQASAPEHVVYIGTASKALAPGVRLAWMALPRRMVDDVVTAKTQGFKLGGTLDQLALAEFFAAAEYDRHVRRSRLSYRRRRDQLVAALEDRAPTTHVSGIAAGLHALVELAPGQREEAVVDRAGRVGLALKGLHAYAGRAQRERQALVVGYGTPPESSFTTALTRLADVLGS